MSNLLKDASILLTPTAYENGRMNAIKPSKDLYGPELVTNGDFATDSDWILANGAVINNGSVNIIGVGSQFRQDVLTSGKSYKLDYQVISTNGASFRFQDGVTAFTDINQTVGYHTYYFKATGVRVQFQALGNINARIDNVSVKEDLSGDFNFERNSAATRVNAQGLVENVQIISPELVSNGNFSQIGTEKVLNGDFSQEGSELVTNGDFSNGSANWGNYTTGSSTIVFTDVATLNVDSSNSNVGIYQENVFTSGKQYKVVVRMKASSSFDAELLETQGASIISTIGSVSLTTSYQDFTFYCQGTGTNDLFIHRKSSASSANQSITIDNVSVKEVAQDWTLRPGWSIAEDKAVANTIGNANLFQTTAITSGKIYKATFEVLDYQSGNVRINLGGAGLTGVGNMYSANGVYTQYITSDGADVYIQGRSSFIGSVTNISVKEVGQDWTVTDSDANNYVEFNQEQGTARLKFLNTSPITNLKATAQYVGGKKYKLIVDVAEVVSGGIKIDAGGVSQTYNSVGIQEAIIEPTGTSFIYFYRATSNVDITLNSVSLKEITDDTNLPRINYEGFSYQDVLGSELVLNSNFNDNSWWGLDANWSILNGAANSNGTGTIYKGGVLTVGKNYKVVVSVSSYTSGTLNYPNASKFLPSESGVYTFYYTANSQTVSFTGNSFIGSIDNVSVKEVTGQEVVPDSGCGSWLLEPQSTNLLEQSELFSDSYWSKSGASVVDGFISPEGLSNAYKLVENTATTTHQIQRSFSFLNQKYSLSAFLKADERNWIKVNLYDGSSSVYAYFDLTNGVVGQELGATGKIENYGNGWYRCSIATTLSVSAGTGNISLRLAENNGGTGYVGDGTSGAYIYGAMLEQQSHPTSYIPTSGASATRLQDIANNSGNSTLINSTEGVLYADIAALANDGTIRFLGLNDGSSNNRVVILYHSGNNNIRAILSSGSTKYVDVSSSVTSVLDFHKVAIRYSSSEFSLWIDGVKVATETSLNAPIGLDRLDFDINGSNPFYGKNKALAVYKEALTDANLRCLTYPNPVATTFDLDFDTIAEQFTFTRGSEATFVNEQGLIQSTNQIGPELVTNGDFATDSDWNKGTGWSINGGKADSDGSGNYQSISQSSLVSPVGKTYKVTYEVSDYVSGEVRCILGGFTLGQITSSNGVVTEYLTASNASSNTFVYIETRGSGFIGSIDNVSVKEVISATNTPRIDYSTGAEAFLLEPQGTNLFPYSEDFTQWDKVGTTVIANSIISPSGTLNSDKIEEIASGTYHNVNEDFGTLSSGLTYTASAFYKSAERTSATIYENLSTGSLKISSFNLTNGTVISEDAAHTATIKDYGNGWYKCSITFTLNASRSGSVFYGTNDTLIFTGVSGNGVYIWGAQLEQRSYATSYIPTSGAAATRNQELCNNATPVINSEEGTLYAEISALGLESSSSLGVSDGSGSNRVLILLQSNGDIRGFIASNGVIVFDEIYSGISALNNNKIAISYKLNNFTLWINGVKIFTDTSGNTPIGLSELSFDNGSGASNFFGNTKDLKYYPKALADVQLEALTSFVSFTEMANALNYTII